MLAEEKLKSLNKKGYFTINNLFTPEDTAILSDARNRLVRTANDLMIKSSSSNKANKAIERIDDSGSSFVYWNNRPKLVSWAGQSEPAFIYYGRDKRILEIVSEIFQHAQAQHLINQVHFKLPGVNDIYPLHLDIAHRQSRGWDSSVNDGVNYLQIAVALDLATEGNGTLRFLPGYIGPADLKYDPREELNPKLYELSQPVILRPGDAVFFTPYVPHGSGINLTSRPRGLLINGFAYPGACLSVNNYPGEGVGELVKLK